MQYKVALQNRVINVLTGNETNLRSILAMDVNYCRLLFLSLLSVSIGFYPRTAVDYAKDKRSE